METLRVPVQYDYSENLRTTVRLLHTVHNELLAQVVNLAISGDLHTLAKGIDDNIVINFKYNDFTSLPDMNVQHMIELIELIKDKMRVLVDANKIERAELN